MQSTSVLSMCTPLSADCRESLSPVIVHEDEKPIDDAADLAGLLDPEHREGVDLLDHRQEIENGLVLPDALPVVVDQDGTVRPHPQGRLEGARHAEPPVDQDEIDRAAVEIAPDIGVVTVPRGLVPVGVEPAPRADL